MRHLNTLIRDLRVINNCTQRQIADALSIDPSAYSKFERNINYISVDKCQEMMDFLSIPMEDFWTYLQVYQDDDFDEKTKLEILHKLIALVNFDGDNIEPILGSLYSLLSSKYEQCVELEELIQIHQNNIESLIDSVVSYFLNYWEQDVDEYLGSRDIFYRYKTVEQLAIGDREGLKDFILGQKDHEIIVIAAFSGYYTTSISTDSSQVISKKLDSWGIIRRLINHYKHRKHALRYLYPLLSKV